MSFYPRSTGRRLLLMASAAAAIPGLACAQAPPPGASAGAAPAEVGQVIITASRLNLLGVAITASQGSVTQKEIELRPIYRVGQLLESTPGLVVTSHSGEGKANQYLIRGFNLDHGTDIANFVDDMPVNRPTNTHGQGYSDVNFLTPQMAAGMDYTKGPYYAAVGDFGAVASTHLKLANELPNQIALTGGTLGIWNAFLGGTYHLGDNDRVVGGLYYGHVDGPFDHTDNFHKATATARYSHGRDADGYSVTAMYYKGDGNFTTDQPKRAFDSGLIGRYGTLDPSDGNKSERMSLSAHFAKQGDDWQFSSSAYLIHSRMTLWNDFTHFLDDPINGDQEEQTEDRTTGGGQASFRRSVMFGQVKSDWVVGLQERYDQAYVDRRHTLRRKPLSYCSVQQPSGPAIQQAAANGVCLADRVHLSDTGGYIENTTHWTPWLRTVVGAREEYYWASDHSLISGFDGSTHQTLFQPKGSLVFGPWAKTELYLSGGRGFHSDDVRGVFGTVPLEGSPASAGPTPLLARATGYELGLRTNLIPKLQIQIALFREDFDSELRYVADIGQDSASAPSRRQGIEFSAEYRPFPWIELNTDLAFSQARYKPASLAAFDLSGPFIANAPSFIGSFGALVDNLGPWFGGLQWRILGTYPISDGEEFPSDKGYSEVNIDVGYRISPHLKIQANVFNLFNTHANSAAYFYGTRLRGEPADGFDDYQIHPIEPLSAQFTITATF
jgi:outer membrane receptor protein involved in Fe transport